MRIVAITTLLFLSSLTWAQSANTAPVLEPSPAINLKTDANGLVSPEQIRQLFERAEQNDLQNEKLEREYTYDERVERHVLDSSGAVKKIETSTSEIIAIYGEQVARVTSRDNKPLSPNDAKKEDDKIQKIIDKRKGESDGDRRKRLEKAEKDREEDRKFVLEIADAFTFRLVGSETVDGKEAWVFEGDPRPDYHAKSRGAKMLSKFKGRIWINKADLQWVKIDMTAIDTLSIGFALARIHKGTHLIIDLTKVNDEVWLPKRLQFHFDARVALFKSYDDDVEQTYSNYKKFRADSKITVVGETH